MFNKKNKEEEYKVFVGGGVIIYKKPEFEKLIKIVKILQYNIFYKDNFSSADAYAALERT